MPRKERLIALVMVLAGAALTVTLAVGAFLVNDHDGDDSAASHPVTGLPTSLNG